MSVKGFAATVPFENAQVCPLDFLVSRKPLCTAHALPAAPNTPPVFGQAGIDDFVFKAAAFGAIHLVVARGIFLQVTQGVVEST
jgi:hypothetical protein